MSVPALGEAERCLDTPFGGAGPFKRHPLGHHDRDVGAGTLHPFSNDVAREIIGKAGLNVPLDDHPR